MEEEAVADFERRLLDVLVRAMGRVAGLEGDDFAPAIRAELSTGRARVEAILKKGAPRDLVEQDDLTTQAPRRRRSDVLGSRMGVLGGAEDGLGLALPIDLVNVGDF